MKKFFYLLIITVWASSVNGQIAQGVLTETFKCQPVNKLPGVQVIDTLLQYVERASGFTIYSGQMGYVFGTSYQYDSANSVWNSLTDESGNQYDAVANASVTEVLFWAAKAVINGTADNISANIYDVDADSMPLNLMSTNSFSMSNVTAANMLTYTSIPVVPPANTNGNPFFVSIAYPGVDDSLGIVSTKAGDGLVEKRVRQLANSNFGGGWKRLGDFYNFIDVDVVVVPIVDITSGTGDHFIINETSLKHVYPAPAKDEITIDYTLKNDATVSYSLFDNNGKIVASQESAKTKAGHYAKNIDVSKCAAGKYYLTFVSNGSPVTQKVMIVK